MTRPIARVCVYCASSRRADPVYREAARALGRGLAEAGVEIAYGGGAIGSMGALADGALEAGGSVIGVLPRFMEELEWGHRGLSRLEVVNSMHERKAAMLAGADGVVALPGGCGTFEELLEAITWKRLGLFTAGIVLVNTRGFWDPLVAALGHAVDEGFMHEAHRTMWSVVSGPEGVLQALREAPPWSAEARRTAVP